MREVVTASGNKTLRVFFDGALNQDEQDALLSSQQKLGFSWERADDRLVAIDVHPESNYQAVCDKLWELEQNGTLAYETCEPRAPGSFDDLPETEQ